MEEDKQDLVKIIDKIANSIRTRALISALFKISEKDMRKIDDHKTMFTVKAVDGSVKYEFTVTDKGEIISVIIKEISFSDFKITYEK